jgi:hypothetical protein
MAPFALVFGFRKWFQPNRNGSVRPLNDWSNGFFALNLCTIELHGEPTIHSHCRLKILACGAYETASEDAPITMRIFSQIFVSG